MNEGDQKQAEAAIRIYLSDNGEANHLEDRMIYRKAALF